MDSGSSNSQWDQSGQNNNGGFQDQSFNPIGQGLPQDQGAFGDAAYDPATAQGGGMATDEFGNPIAAGTQAPPVEDTTPANFQLGIKLPPTIGIKLPAHGLNFDEQYFLRLLAGSISLSKDEKKKIIEAVPKLSQFQIDELMRIFEEEKQKFSLLSVKHVPHLEKLATEYYNQWMDLETEQVQINQANQDQAQADEIRRQLGMDQ